MVNDQAELQHYAEFEYQDTFDEVLASMNLENGLGFDGNITNSNSWFDL